MSRCILPLLLLVCLAGAGPTNARTLIAKIAAVDTAVAALEGVEVRLEWPADADAGQLSVRARHMAAVDLGYRFEQVSWRCPLRRNGTDGWRCDGEVRSGRNKPMRLSLDLAAATTDAVLSNSNGSKFALHRNAAAPDITQLDLTQVPVAWAQALVSQMWEVANLKSGSLDGRLAIRAPETGPLRVEGPLTVSGLGLDTPDGTIAAEGLGGRFTVDYRRFPQASLIAVDGELQGGEILVGNAYFALPATPVALSVAASQQGSEGWRLPQILWDDGDALRMEGSLAFSPELSLTDADLRLRSPDIAPLRARYLSGWLGLFGLSELQMSGALSAHTQIEGGQLLVAEAELAGISLRDAQDRFRFEGLSGAPKYSAGAPVESELSWHGGDLLGLPFGAATFPLRSSEGAIGFRREVAVPVLGGQLRFDDLTLHPPAGERGMAFDFGLSLDRLDIGRLAQALDWPPFKGELSGRIPRVRYADDRLDFDGALTAHIFGGTVRVSGLAMERPFGTAPTLSADIAIDDLDLESLTGVFGFGEITGALDGHINDLRLVDWSAETFDADLHSDPSWKGRQRISQRAVQDLSSVGGGDGLGSSLQAQALKLFDDFGYRRIGIRCRLAREVCAMDGLRSAGEGFIIVEGSGVPRLSVVGFNHQVDWPTLVDRLIAVTQGESKPVFE
ncbi:hypothetical protein [Pseudoxanthomonas sp. UTMC 1351]|uniref:hypothetical protein n=1 Tax=Pseudoxanthomonas sp. UTMC 1351 TaxID=2695853 RepID=UPI0034CD433B